jgi:hypothetical protein
MKRSKKLPSIGWKWPTGWKEVRLPTDTEDHCLEMELAEMFSEAEERRAEKAPPAKPAS